MDVIVVELRFILENFHNNAASNITMKKMVCYNKPESIACIIACLGREEPADALKQSFPSSASMVLSREWTACLQKEVLKNIHRTPKEIARDPNDEETNPVEGQRKPRHKRESDRKATNFETDFEDDEVSHGRLLQIVINFLFIFSKVE